MNNAIINNIINEIGSFNNAVFTETLIGKTETVFKFEATKFAAEGIANVFKPLGVRILKWSNTNEYFFAISNSNEIIVEHYNN
jgi:hypothetical protein